MKLLKEMYGGVHGLDNFDRAVEMINAAVEHHDRNDNFDAIADIDGLIGFLKGQYHDFTPALEETVRGIIADELSGSEEEQEIMKSDEEMDRDKAVRGMRFNKAIRAKRGWGDYKTPQSGRYHEQLTKAAKGEEEESRLDKFKRERDEFWKEQNLRKQARKYGISGPSGRRSRMGSRSRGRLTSTEQEETISDRIERMRAETRKVLDDSDKRRQARKYGISGPSRRSGGVRRRGTGRARGTFGLEQEERKTNYDMQTTDWDKEVADFRERRKKYEPEAARSQRRSRRRMGGSSGNAFSLRFESFKGFLEKDSEAPKSK